MCKTRWSERRVSYEHFYLALPFIVEALEIINGTQLTITRLMKSLPKNGTRNQKKEATPYINAFTSFEYVSHLYIDFYIIYRQA